MKKTLFLLIAMLALALTSCDFLPHEHAYGEDWQKDSDYHWHECTAVDGCPEKGDKAEHDYEVSIGEDEKLVNVCKVCGHSNEKVSTAESHDHVFSTDYKHSENFHWHECQVEGCYEIDKNDEHQYGNPEAEYEDSKLKLTYTCVDCAYVKTEIQTVESEVDDAVEWDNIFESFKLTNFSMYVFFGEKENPDHTNHCVVTDDCIYYCIPDGVEFYVSKNSDGSYEGYQRHDSDDDFIKMSPDVAGKNFVGAARETVIQVTFANYFDKFEYDAERGAYTSDEEIPAVYYDIDGTEQGTLYCFNTEVKVADGKIISISADYKFRENDESEHSFIYFNIGMSEMKIPQSVIDSALSEGADQNFNGDEDAENHPSGDVDAQ